MSKNEEISVIQKAEEWKQDGYRYVNLLLFILAALANSFPTQTFAAVSPTIKHLYSLSEIEANLNSLIYPVAYILFTLPCNYIIDHYGLKTATLICQICMLVGYAFHLMINVHFYFFLFGTICCSLGFCVMISSTNKFANFWFPVRQISVVNSVVVFAIFGSDALGIFCSALFIQENATKQVLCAEIDSIFFFHRAAQHTWCNSVGSSNWVPRSAKASAKVSCDQSSRASTAARSSFTKDLHDLRKNKTYRGLFGAMTCVFSSVTLLFVGLPWIVLAYGMDPFTSGAVVILANVCGGIGSFISSAIAHKNYKVRCQICVLAAIVGMVGSLLGFQINCTPLVYVANAIVGLFVYPFIITAVDYATQTTFPVGEATATGLLFVGGQFFGVLLSIAFSFYLDGTNKNQPRITTAVIFTLLFASLIFLSLTKPQLKRNYYQQNNHSLLSQASL